MLPVHMLQLRSTCVGESGYPLQQTIYLFREWVNQLCLYIPSSLTGWRLLKLWSRVSLTRPTVDRLAKNLSVCFVGTKRQFFSPKRRNWLWDPSGSLFSEYRRYYPVQLATYLKLVMNFKMHGIMPVIFPYACLLCTERVLHLTFRSYKVSAAAIS